jgi:hypothetical protein
MRLVLIGFWISNRPTYKVSISSIGADGKPQDFDNPLNDPKPYLLYGKYVEE